MVKMNNKTEMHGFNLFGTDHVFYGVMLVIISFVVLLGLFLFICMIYKPSFGSQTKLSRSSHVLHNCEMRRDTELPTISGQSGRTRLQNDKSGKQSANGPKSGSRTGSSSILDTRLPPLAFQTNNTVIKPGEIQKLHNDLEGVERNRNVRNLEGSTKELHLENQSLDISSLSNADVNY